MVSRWLCALIMWRSSLGLLMVKFRQILTELSARMAGYYSLTFLFSEIKRLLRNKITS